jgi:thiol-disulfide isomerase/thioredoxin
MQQITTDELKEKIANKESFVLDLFATWCGPCKMMHTSMVHAEQLTEQRAKGKPTHNFYQLDIESDREYVIGELGIRSVPTLKVFTEGQETYSKAGVLTTNEIYDLVK